MILISRRLTNNRINKGMILIKTSHQRPNERRFDVYYTLVHGRKWIGASNNIVRAMAIGRKLGCYDPECLCQKYVLYDNKLKTDRISEMLNNWVEMDYQKR